MAGYGMQSHVMVQFQSSFGTSLVSSLHAIAINNETLVNGIEQIIEDNMYARFDESPSHEGTFEVSGDITQQISPISIGWFLKSALGLVSTTSDTGTQTHLFRGRTSDFDAYAAGDPMTAEVYLDVSSAVTFYDLIGNTMSIEIANGELLSSTLGVVGAGFAVKGSAASTPTFPTAKPFKWDQGSHQWSGIDILDIQNLTININNNVASRYTLQNTNSPHKIKRTAMRTIEINGTMTFQQHSYWDAYNNQSELPLVMNFASSEAPNAVLIDIPSFRLTSFDPVINGPGVIEAAFSGKAKFNTGSNTAMDITLVNTQPYY